MNTTQLHALEQLFARFTPDEQRLLVAARDYIADLPPEQQTALAKQIAAFAHQRIQN